MSAPPKPGTAPQRAGLAVGAILGIGAAIRVIQYATGGSFWIDELLIALNVTRSGWADLLLAPLAYNQVAPIGFLALEKLAAVALGNTELALRLFPTLLSLLALFLFWRISRRYLEGGALLAALTLFAINPTLLWTARHAKQYSGDVAVTLFLLLLALRVREDRIDVRAAWAAGAAGGVAILLSQPGALVAFYLWTALLFLRLGARAPLLPLAPLGAGWGLGAVVVGITSLNLSPPKSRDFMSSGWSHGFIVPPKEDPLSLPRLVYNYVAYFFGNYLPSNLPETVLTVLLIALLVAGAWRLARSQPAGAALLAVPVAVVVFSAGVRLLPFSGRVSAFVGPALVVLVAVGLAALRLQLPRRARAAGFAAALFVCASPALAQLFLIPPIYRREDARPILEAVRERWQPGDVIYTLHGGHWAMNFYGQELGLGSWFGGQDHAFAPRAYLEDVDGLRGRSRVWFFFTHAKRCEPETVMSYFDAIGTRIHAIEDPDDNRGKREAAAYLYDLSDPGRLARESAATHSVPSSPTDCDRAPMSQAEIILQQFRALVGA